MCGLMGVMLRRQPSAVLDFEAPFILGLGFFVRDLPGYKLSFDIFDDHTQQQRIKAFYNFRSGRISSSLGESNHRSCFELHMYHQTLRGMVLIRASKELNRPLCAFSF